MEQLDNQAIANIFKALSDKHRIAIVKFLQQGPKCACEISQALTISQSKLSYHMKILCDSQVVECWYEGKWTHYQISYFGSQTALECLQKITKVNYE